MPTLEGQAEVTGYQLSVIFQAGANTATHLARLNTPNGVAEVLFTPDASLNPVGNMFPGAAQIHLPSDRFGDFYRVLTSDTTVTVSAQWEEPSFDVLTFRLGTFVP
jgi:hypothetical protein